jgi:hypothetical protein
MASPSNMTGNTERWPKITAEIKSDSCHNLLNRDAICYMLLIPYFWKLTDIKINFFFFHIYKTQILCCFLIDSHEWFYFFTLHNIADSWYRYYRIISVLTVICDLLGSNSHNFCCHGIRLMLVSRCCHNWELIFHEVCAERVITIELLYEWRILILYNNMSNKNKSFYMRYIKNTHWETIIKKKSNVEGLVFSVCFHIFSFFINTKYFICETSRDFCGSF